MGNYQSMPEASQALMQNNKPATSVSSSRRSSVASGTSSADSSVGAERRLLSTAAVTSSSASSIRSHADPAYPMDPLSREFPKPAEEVNVAEMLERKPLRWTLGHYIKTPTREISDPFDDKEKVAQDMEAKKRELLAAKEEMQRLSHGL